MPFNYEIPKCGQSSPAIHGPRAVHRLSYPRSLHNKDSSGTLLGCVPEEQEFLMEGGPCDTDSAQWLWDKELERQGLFRGTHTRYLLCIHVGS